MTQACSWHGLWDFLKQNVLQKVTNAFMLMIPFRSAEYRVLESAQVMRENDR